MAHFHITEEVADVPQYLFQADLAISIIPPTDYAAVPKTDGTFLLMWD